jgi:hypothetical protein
MWLGDGTLFAARSLLDIWSWLRLVTPVAQSRRDWSFFQSPGLYVGKFSKETEPVLGVVLQGHSVHVGPISK